jgi:hypothetical protein
MGPPGDGCRGAQIPGGSTRDARGGGRLHRVPRPLGRALEGGQGEPRHAGRARGLAEALLARGPAEQQSGDRRLLLAARPEGEEELAGLGVPRPEATAERVRRRTQQARARSETGQDDRGLRTRRPLERAERDRDVRGSRGHTLDDREAVRPDRREARHGHGAVRARVEGEVAQGAEGLARGGGERAGRALGGRAVERPGEAEPARRAPEPAEGDDRALGDRAVLAERAGDEEGRDVVGARRDGERERPLVARFREPEEPGGHGGRAVADRRGQRRLPEAGLRQRVEEPVEHGRASEAHRLRRGLGPSRRGADEQRADRALPPSLAPQPRERRGHLGGRPRRLDEERAEALRPRRTDVGHEEVERLGPERRIGDEVPDRGRLVRGPDAPGRPQHAQGLRRPGEAGLRAAEQRGPALDPRAEDPLARDRVPADRRLDERDHRGPALDAHAARRRGDRPAGEEDPREHERRRGDGACAARPPGGPAGRGLEDRDPREDPDARGLGPGRRRVRGARAVEQGGERARRHGRSPDPRRARSASRAWWRFDFTVA